MCVGGGGGLNSTVKEKFKLCGHFQFARESINKEIHYLSLLSFCIEM